MPVGMRQIPAKETMVSVELIRLPEISHLGIRHKTHLGNDLMPGILSSSKEVAKGPTAMMMVTRRWRVPGTQDSRTWCPRVHLELSWDLASCRHTMSATSLIESICLNSWRGKAHQVLHALDPGS